MRTRIRMALVALVVAATACSAAPPEADQDVPTPATPMGAVDLAQNVADQVEQRQADLEAYLDDPFQQP